MVPLYLEVAVGLALGVFIEEVSYSLGRELMRTSGWRGVLGTVSEMWVLILV
jgi:hypothetical protein